MSFPQKTDHLLRRGVLTVDVKKAYDRINELRNDFSHIFGFDQDEKYFFNLALEIEAYGIDFSDEIGDNLECTVEKYGNKEGILAEILWSVLFDAANVLQEQGGRDIF